MATNSTEDRGTPRPSRRYAPSAGVRQTTWQQAALAAGHERIEMLLSPDAIKALAAIKTFTNVRSDTLMIERLIISAARKLRPDTRSAG